VAIGRFAAHERLLTLPLGHGLDWNCGGGVMALLIKLMHKRIIHSIIHLPQIFNPYLNFLSHVHFQGNFHRCIYIIKMEIITV
jgi:hypothetical protein